jgi:hypothetical protein
MPMPTPMPIAVWRLSVEDGMGVADIAASVGGAVLGAGAGEVGLGVVATVLRYSIVADDAPMVPELIVLLTGTPIGLGAVVTPRWEALVVEIELAAMIVERWIVVCRLVCVCTAVVADANTKVTLNALDGCDGPTLVGLLIGAVVALVIAVVD